MLLALGFFAAASATAETIVVSPSDPALNGGYVYPRLLEDERDLATLVPRGEGWVQFAADIDTTGKATNVRVLRTSGNAAQVRHVLDRVTQWRWQPATSGGEPVIETAMRLVRFQTRKPMDAKADAAAGEAFAATVRAVETGDRAAAESQLDKLRQRERNNSAEYTLLKIGESLVQRRWGTPLAEFEALTDAFAGGSGAFAGLPPQYRRSATMDLLRLRLAAGQYADARSSAQTAERLTDDKATKTKLAGVLARIAEIESSSEPCRMQTSLGPGGLASD